MTPWPGPPPACHVVWQAVVPGPPVPKARPRFGQQRTYTPAKTVEYEHRVGAHVLRARPRPLVPEAGLLGVRLHFALGANRGDLDNYVKGCIDGLTTYGLAMKNDSQVKQEIVTWEVDRKNPRTEILLYRLVDTDSGS